MTARAIFGSRDFNLGGITLSKIVDAGISHQARQMLEKYSRPCNLRKHNARIRKRFWLNGMIF